MRLGLQIYLDNLYRLKITSKYKNIKSLKVSNIWHSEHKVKFCCYLFGRERQVLNLCRPQSSHV